MGAKWVHRLVSKDLDTMTGVCSNCGEVRLRKKRNGARCQKAAASHDSPQTRVGGHGLTRGDAQQFITGKSCAICESTERLCVDHCHETGRIRGVLCWSCNVALGHLRDNVELLLTAISYLESKEVE